MTKILLTGTTGFLGYEFLKSIIDEKKYNIIDIIRSDKKKLKNLRNKNKNYTSIKFHSYDDLKKKLMNKKFDMFINFATNYKNSHEIDDIKPMIESNIYFPNLILELLAPKLKKFITFGSIMEFNNSTNYKPKNYYSSTKKAFEDILDFYKLKYSSCKFLIIKFHDTFGDQDNRKKLLPTIIKSVNSNIKFQILNKNLKLNVISTTSINCFIKQLIDKNNSYSKILLKNKKNLNIYSLLKKIAKKKGSKLNFKISNKPVNFLNSKSIKNHKIIFLNDNIEKLVLKKII